MSGRRDDVFDPETRPTSPARVVGGVPAEIWVVGRASTPLAPVRFCTPNVCVNSQKPGHWIWFRTFQFTGLPPRRSIRFPLDAGHASSGTP